MIWTGRCGAAGIFLDAENSRTDSGALTRREIRDFDFRASGPLRRT